MPFHHGVSPPPPGDEFMDLRKQRSDDRPGNKRRVANALMP